MTPRIYTIIAVFFLTVVGSLKGFEGKITFNISSADRDWSMVTMVKGDMTRANIFFGDMHFQSIFRNAEGVFVVDELNKQVYPSEFERTKWGLKEKVERKRKVRFEKTGELDHNSHEGDVFVIDSSKGDFVVETIVDHGYMPGAFLDQFESMRSLFESGEVLFRDYKRMPYRIYKKGRSKDLLLELTGIEEASVEDSTFVVPESYVRAKLKFKMR